MRRRWLLLAGILTALPGCDNVTWGGTEVHMQAPPERAEAPPSAGAEGPSDVPPPPEVPTGPILLAGVHERDTASLTAVGEVSGDGLRAFPTETETPGFLAELNRVRFAPGTELVLFAAGARVGRLTVTGTGVDADRFCAPRTTVRGVVEMLPGASQVRRILALADTAATHRPYTPLRVIETDYAQRTASLAMASTALPQVGAPWPPSLLEARADVQAFQLPESDAPSVASTFLYNEELAASEPGPNAYSIFLTGTRAAGGYQTDYVGYRRADRDGKGAPRYFDHLDLNGDGSSEILLDVFGARNRWFAALARRNGTWVRSFQDPCGDSTG